MSMKSRLECMRRHGELRDLPDNRGQRRHVILYRLSAFAPDQLLIRSIV